MKYLVSIFLSCLALQAFCGDIIVPVTEGVAVPDSFWQGRKKANANLCFVENRVDVSATLVAEGTPNHPKIWSGLLDSPTNRITWGVIWQDVCMSPDLLGNTWTSATYPPGVTSATTPTPAGDKKMLGNNGVVKAGQYVGFEAWGDGAKVYTISEYNYDWNVGWLYFAIPSMPDHCLACLEERPIILNSDRDFNDVVLLINMGAANVQATMANQGFTPQVDPNSQLGQVLAPYLPVEPLSLGPVAPTFVAFGAAIDTAVPVEGKATGYAAEALPQSTVYNLTSIKSQAVVPSGKYKSKLKAWNRSKTVEAYADIRVNFPPVARAGLAEKVGVGTINLDASGSTDQDTDQTLGFKWTQTAGPVVAITNPCQKVASCKVNKIGTYKFRVEASDGMNTSTAEKIVTVSGPWGNLLVTHVEIRGTLDSSTKVETYVNGNLASRSQKVWWYRFPVVGDGAYICNIEAKEKGTSKVLDSKLVTVLVGDVYGQQPVDLEKGKGSKPPTAPDDF